MKQLHQSFVSSLYKELRIDKNHALKITTHGVSRQNLSNYSELFILNHSLILKEVDKGNVKKMTYEAETDKMTLNGRISDPNTRKIFSRKCYQFAVLVSRGMAHILVVPQHAK